MNASIRKFVAEEDGVTALEYGLLAAVIAGVLIVVAKPALEDMFGTLFDKLKAVATSATT
ncbi:Flp family type IVb pilin [Stenotrophomonas rhizophila]|uniref:Flp family type IVb pilin n=1 Tax=Stenotrophomonas rhizophila TaxID=216778 RepID=UPI001E2DFBC5|nr:Flp family type IVb pilin [Stenotrophomonas rhizophila]MCC7633894.1 Flp family type IVb pilin [Stenotrophomonas rhizophila]MCC7663228.1 Flp family type IVb pilin [Stenotrophomonas rhizophila]